jgi:hypothetical protein
MQAQNRKNYRNKEINGFLALIKEKGEHCSDSYGIFFLR